MEVHHHPDVHHKRKRFKEYFLEFLMIFLAVTLGFFAENIRESMVEKETERTYIESFYKDISNDEQQIPRLIKSQGFQIKCADSLVTLLDSSDIKKTANFIYYYAKNIVRQTPLGFVTTERTITQLKNSGGFRLIHNQELSDSIIDYYKMADEVKFLQGWVQGYKQTLEQSYSYILWGHYYHKMIDSTDRIIMPAENLFLKSADKDAISNCVLQISEIQGLSIAINRATKKLEEQAMHLKEYIENKYHFEK
jgi:hypothetical protein